MQPCGSGGVGVRRVRARKVPARARKPLSDLAKAEEERVVRGPSFDISWIRCADKHSLVPKNAM